MIRLNEEYIRYRHTVIGIKLLITLPCWVFCCIVFCCLSDHPSPHSWNPSFPSLLPLSLSLCLLNLSSSLCICIFPTDLLPFPIGFISIARSPASVAFIRPLLSFPFLYSEIASCPVLRFRTATVLLHFPLIRLAK